MSSSTSWQNYVASVRLITCFLRIPRCTLRIDNNYFFIFWNLIYNVNYEFISRNFLCFVFIQGRSYQKCLRTSEASKNRNYSFFRPFRPFYPIEAFLVSISEVLALCIPKVNFLQFLTNCLVDFGEFFDDFLGEFLDKWAKLRQPTGQSQDNFNFGPSLNSNTPKTIKVSISWYLEV